MDRVRLARQAILDRGQQVVGYELLFRDSGSEVDDPRPVDEQERFDGDRATSSVIVATFLEFGLAEVAGDGDAFINVTRQFLTGEQPLPFGSEGVVLELLENIDVDDEVLAGARRLREAGYRLALDDFTWSTQTERLLSLADIVKVDIQMHGLRALPGLVARLRQHDVKLLAEKVETEAQLKVCEELGFDYYQGYLFSRPVIISGQRLDPGAIAWLRLVALLQDENSSLEDIERAVRSDPEFALTVLRAANAAAHGTAQQVSSLAQAIVAAGRLNLLVWSLLRMKARGRAPQADVVRSVLARARMVELLAARAWRDKRAADGAFIVGLVSGLDRLLGVPPSTVVSHLPIDPALRNAVLNQEGRLGLVLSTVLAYEHEDRPLTRWLPPPVLRQTSLEAWRWAGTQLPPGHPSAQPLAAGVAGGAA